MNKKLINIEFEEYHSIDEGVNAECVDLIEIADANLKNSYSPYSKFKVSAACLMSDGEVVLGTNQENGAYPSGICAERVAVFSAKSKFPNQKINKIVVTTEQSNTFPFTPCGACRQVIAEYEMLQKEPIQIILKSGNSKIWVFNSIKDLLPFSFDGEMLKKKG